MVVVDTSVWIDAFNGKKSREVEILADLIRQEMDVCLTPTILQEVLQGLRSDEDFNRLRYGLGGFNILLCDQVDSAVQAASLYWDIRKKGVTIRKSNDCLIAAYAISFSAEILHRDRDYDIISRHSALKIFRVD